MPTDPSSPTGTSGSSTEQAKTITLYKYLSAEALKKFVKNKTLKLSFGYEANDRFEMLRGDLVPGINMAVQEMLFEAGVRIGFISLTAVKENPYMWGYYSEKYTGARLTLRFKVIKCHEGNRYLRQDKPVPRQKELININYARFDGEYIERCEYEVNRLDKIETELSKCTQNIISNKHISWSGEQEYRILYSVDNLRGNGLSPLLQEDAQMRAIYTTSDLNRNIISLELAPFCDLSVSDLKRTFAEDDLLRGIEIKRLKFVPCLYLTRSDQSVGFYEDFIQNDPKLRSELQARGIHPVPECNWSSLMTTARRGDLAELDSIGKLCKEFNVHSAYQQVDYLGHNALTLAVIARSFECVDFLLNQGATMEYAKQEKKNEALLWASSVGHVGFVEKLLRWGADIRTADIYGRTPLHLAARNSGEKIEGRSCEKCAIIILNYIYDNRGLLYDEMSRKDDEGRTPLILAAWGKSLEVVKYLVEAKVDINATDYDNSTALIMAAWGKPEEDVKDSFLVSYLLSKGADPEVRENVGISAAFYAARHGRIECLKLLLEAAPISRGNKMDHKSLILYSLLGGSIECIRHVISLPVSKKERKNENSFDKDIFNWNNLIYIIIRYCCREGRPDTDGILKLISQYGLIQSDCKLDIKVCRRDPSIILRLAAYGQNELLKQLLPEEGSKQLMELRDKGGCSALMWSVTDDTPDNVANVTTIIDIIGSDSILTKDRGGCNAIMWAARKGSKDCLQALLASFAEHEIERILLDHDKNGMTALMWAAWKGKLECMELILNTRHSGLTLQDAQGNTALDWAVKGGNEKCVHLLLERGAKFGKHEWE